MKRKLLTLALCAALALCALPMAASAEGNVAKIGDKEYATLQEAVDDAPDNIQTTITLLGDASGDGVIVPSNKNITFDLADSTYTVSGKTVGSSGTETNGFQLLKDSTIVFKNGGIKSTSNTCNVLIQNYSNLTLENVTLEGQQLAAGANSYVLSNNNGSVQLTGSTSITAPDGGVAFDMYYWPSNGYTDGVQVTVNTTGTITGKIEYTRDTTTNDQTAAEKNVLTIVNVKHEGAFNVPVSGANITVSGGTFSNKVPDAYLKNGFAPTLGADGKYTVSALYVAQVDEKNYTDLTSALTALATAKDKTLVLSPSHPDVPIEVNAPLVITVEGVTVKGGILQPSASFTPNGSDGSVITVTANNVTLDGVTVDAGAVDKGDVKYAVQFFGVTGGKVNGGTIKNDGWAGILLNGSTATVTGTAFDLSGSCYAAIELGKGSGVTTDPNLTLAGTVSFANSNTNTADANRLIWVDVDPANDNESIPAGMVTANNLTVKTSAGDMTYDANGLLVTKPAPQPEEPDEPSAPAATPAPAPVLDSTPKTGAVSLSLLPLAGLGLAALGAVSRKRR